MNSTPFFAGATGVPGVVAALERLRRRADRVVGEPERHEQHGDPQAEGDEVAVVARDLEDHHRDDRAATTMIDRHDALPPRTGQRDPSGRQDDREEDDLGDEAGEVPDHGRDRRDHDRQNEQERERRGNPPVHRPADREARSSIMSTPAPCASRSLIALADLVDLRRQSQSTRCPSCVSDAPTAVAASPSPPPDDTPARADCQPVERGLHLVDRGLQLRRHRRCRRIQIRSHLRGSRLQGIGTVADGST